MVGREAVFSYFRASLNTKFPASTHGLSGALHREIKMKRTALRSSTAALHLLQNRRGSGIVEYGILAGLISVIAVGAIAYTGGNVATLFGGATTAMADGPSTPTPASPEDDAAPSEMPIYVRGAGSTGETDSGTTVSSTIAAGTQPGDLLVAFVMHRSALLTPEGWEKQLTQVNEDYAQWTTVLTKVYSPADGDTQAFEQGAAGRIMANIVTVDGSNPQIATINGRAAKTSPQQPPSFPVADNAGLVISGMSEVYSNNTDDVTMSVEEGWTLHTTEVMPRNRLAVASRQTGSDTEGEYVPGPVFTDTPDQTANWSGITLQVTPGGRATQPAGFGPYTDDVDPFDWLILTDEADTATLSGQKGVLGKAGDDNVTGTSAAETFIGGPGNDYMKGDRGADLYVYSRGEGDDRVWDNGYGDGDRLELRDIAPSDVTFSVVDGDLIIAVDGGGQVLLYDQDTNTDSKFIEQILFKHEGGQDLFANHQAIRDRAVSDMKATGYINGFYHSDNYHHVAAEDGSYTISDFTYYSNQDDTLYFDDATPGQTNFIVKDKNFEITVDVGDGTPDVITIRNQDNNSDDSFVEFYRFADGTILNHQGARNKAADDAKPTGYIDGTHHSEQYFHSVADDEDYTISDFTYYSNQPDSIEFLDATVGQTTFIVSGGDFVITIDNGTGDIDTVTIKGQDNNSDDKLIESFKFQGGVTLDHQGARNKAAEDAKPRGLIDGTHFSENYTHSVANDGNYRIEDFSYYSNQPDSLEFLDANPADIVITREADGDASILVKNEDTVEIRDQFDNSNRRIESFIFQDGTVWTWQDFEANVAP